MHTCLLPLLHVHEAVLCMKPKMPKRQEPLFDCSCTKAVLYSSKAPKMVFLLRRLSNLSLLIRPMPLALFAKSLIGSKRRLYIDFWAQCPTMVLIILTKKMEEKEYITK